MKPAVVIFGGTAISVAIAATTLQAPPSCACGKQLLSPTTQSTALAATPKQAVQAKPKPITRKDYQTIDQLLSGQNWLPTQSFRVNLVDFGNCLFVPVVDSNTNHLNLYLIQNRRIIYTFPEVKQPTAWTPLDVLAVAFTELNFDGGDSDIILISEYVGPGGPATSRPFPVVLIYTTTEKGYEIDQEVSRILTQRKVRTVSEAEKILRNEFNFLP